MQKAKRSGKKLLMKFYQSNNFKMHITQLLIIFGAILMFMGLLNDEIATVFNKAINICMECIGIG